MTVLGSRRRPVLWWCLACAVLALIVFALARPRRVTIPANSNSPDRVSGSDGMPPEYGGDGAFSKLDNTDLRVTDLPPRRFDVIDVHEHVLDMEQAERLLQAGAELGVVHTVLMGTSRYTFTLDKRYGFEAFKENNEEILRIAAAHPGRFSAFVTLHPPDPGNLELLADYVRRGASGLKLYLGHGGSTGDEPFHMMPLDDPRMLPIYAFCERQRLPIVCHVNLMKYYDEFVRVMERFSNLTICVPHFGLHKNSAKRLQRLADLFDRYPGVYSDVGFGWWEFHVQGFRELASHPRRFREFLTRHADRFMFGSDMVLEPSKPTYYIRSTLRSYFQLLEMEHFRFFYLPDRPMRGLNLPDEALQKIYWDTPRRFLGYGPALDPGDFRPHGDE